MELLIGLALYCLSASGLVVAAGWYAPDLGMEPRVAMWSTVQAVTVAPALLAVIALTLVAFA